MSAVHNTKPSEQNEAIPGTYNLQDETIMSQIHQEFFYMKFYVNPNLQFQWHWVIVSLPPRRHRDRLEEPGRQFAE